MPRLFLDPNRIDQRSEAFIERGSGLIHHIMGRYHRADIRGIARIPEGPALYVGNHNGALLSIDSFLWASEVCRQRGVENVPFGLTHSTILKILPFNRALIPMGSVAATHDNAASLFEAGYKALVYPGGDVDTLRPWRERNLVKFDGRAGFIKLALRHNIPIIPVAAQGAHSTAIIIDDLPWLARAIRADKFLRVSRWPLMFTIPWGITLGPSPPYIPLPAKIKIEFLDPIHLDASAIDDDDYVADRAEHVRALLEDTVQALADE